MAAIALLLAAEVAPTPPAETSAAAAVAVVRRYYRAVERHDYVAAHAIWSGGRSLAAFRRGYADTAHVRVTPLPPFAVEGGAGSAYAEIRVVVDAIATDGRCRRFRGRYTLRRVNDVDGSTAAQRRWHVTAARLTPVPAGR